MCRVIDPEKTGMNISRLCKEKGISVREIAKRLNLSDSRVIFYWFSGRNMPTIDNLYMLASILQVQMDDIIIARDEPLKNTKIASTVVEE